MLRGVPDVVLLGNHAEAERLYRRALAIKERAQGPDHPDVGMTLNNLAVCCTAQGRFVEAEAFYQRALAIFEATLGPDHPHVAACRENYALLRETGRASEALALETQTLA